MTTENTYTKPKFAEETAGVFADASSLDCSASAVYYGFNCTPRQVRYYKVEKSVKEILAGGFTRSSVEKFLGKVKEKMSKAELKFAEYEDKLKEVRARREACTDYQTRQILRKEENKVETRAYNYENEVVGMYQRAFESLTKFLAE
jgi:vacuolar-type H+-ATPase subunit I/STV1